MSFDIQVDSFRDVLAAIGEYLLSLSGYIILILLLLLLSRVARNRFEALATRRGLHRSVSDLFDNAVKVVVYVLIGFIILASLGVNTRSLATFAGLVTAALTLSLQDVFKNIFCGFFLLGERPFSAGDRIRIGSEDGTIERIDLRVTRIRNDRQELVLVPNSLFFSQMSIARSTAQRRSLTVQATGIQEAKDAAQDQVQAAIGEVAPERSIVATRLMKVGPAGCDFEVTVGGVGVEDEVRVIDALNAAFPDATIAVIAR